MQILSVRVIDGFIIMSISMMWSICLISVVIATQMYSAFIKSADQYWYEQSVPAAANVDETDKF